MSNMLIGWRVDSLESRWTMMPVSRENERSGGVRVGDVRRTDWNRIGGGDGWKCLIGTLKGCRMSVV